MSLLDDVSIVVTPNGYKAGELYAVIPVPSYGSNQVIDGSFPSGTTAWTEVGTVSYSGDEAILTGDGTKPTQLIQSITGFSVGSSYRIKFNYNNVSSDSIRVNMDGTLRMVASSISSGEYNATFTATATSQALRFYAYTDVGEIAKLSNVIVEEVLVASADMDVTRATAATRVDENGLVNYAEVIGDSALTGNNSNFDTGIGSWVGYNGGALAHSTDKLEVTFTSGESGATIATNSLISGGQTGKTFKVRVKIWQGTTISTALKIYIGGTQENITISSTPTYFEIELTPANSSGLFIYRSVSADTGTFFIDDITVKEVTRDNVPRIDYTGGGCPHILVEPERTNLITYSSDFTTWSIARATLGANITAPNGEADGYSIIATAVNDDHFVYKSISVVNTTTYTYSAYLKKGSKSWARLWNTSVGYADFDLENGVVGTQSSVVGSIDLLNNGWYRCSMVYTAVSTGNDSHRIYTLDGDNDKTFLGDGSTINLYTFGAQLEVGSYPTSLIPTSGSTVTRNQDIFTRDGIGSLINSTEGVLFVEMAALSDDGTFRSISLSNGTPTNRVTVRYNTTSNSISAFVYQGSSTILSYNNIVTDVKDFHKLAIKYKSGDLAFWVDGVEVATSTTSFTFLPLTELDFDRGVGDRFFFGKVKQLQVYDTSLSDEQLLQLTGESGTDFYESYAEMASALTYTIQ